VDPTTSFRRRPGVRRAWRIGGVLLTAVVMVFATGTVVSALAHEEETVEETFDDIRFLEVNDTAGTVRIVGGSGDQVEMTAEVSHGLRRTGLSWEVEGDRLHVESSCPILFTQFCSVSYTFTVPRDLELDIHAERSIEADAVDGDAVLSSDAGRIEVTRMGGNLRMHSDAGRVTGTAIESEQVDASSDAGRVELVFASPPRNVHADSDVGRVEVVVPRTESESDQVYNVHADTDAGDTDVQVVDSPEADRAITATSDAGNVTVRYDSA
jgi:hypothetical protein